MAAAEGEVSRGGGGTQLAGGGGACLMAPAAPPLSRCRRPAHHRWVAARRGGHHGQVQRLGGCVTARRAEARGTAFVPSSGSTLPVAADQRAGPPGSGRRETGGGRRWRADTGRRGRLTPTRIASSRRPRRWRRGRQRNCTGFRPSRLPPEATASATAAAVSASRASAAAAAAMRPGGGAASVADAVSLSLTDVCR